MELSFRTFFNNVHICFLRKCQIVTPPKKLQYRAGSTVLGGGADSVVESGVYGKKCLCYNSSKSFDKQKKMYPKSWEALTRCVCIGGGGQLHDSSLRYIGKKTVCYYQNLGEGAQGCRSSLGPPPLDAMFLEYKSL